MQVRELKNNFKRVGVIGCGVSGIAALRVLSENNNTTKNFDIIGFERSDRIGGIWNYNENSNEKWNTPMYRDLRTNLPKEIMYYPDMFFSSDLKRSFLSHSEVLKYFKDYTRYYDLGKYIKFNSLVKYVEPRVENGHTIWNITVSNTNDYTEYNVELDAVIIAVGNFEKAVLPIIPGIENFQGIAIHSKMYRTPEEFRDKVVFVLGARSSGMDISLQLANTAKKVYLSHNRKRLTWDKYPHNFFETTGIQEITKEGYIKVIGGELYQADCIIFCTGYLLDLDFLSPKCYLQYRDRYLEPLYQHIVNPYYPDSMFFVGLGYEIIPSTHFYLQSKVARAFIEHKQIGVTQDTQELLHWVKQREHQLGQQNLDRKYWHYFGGKEGDYFNDLQTLAANVMTSSISKHLVPLFNFTHKLRHEDTVIYRVINFRITDTNKLGFVIEMSSNEDMYNKDEQKFIRKIIEYFNVFLQSPDTSEIDIL